MIIDELKEYKEYKMVEWVDAQCVVQKDRIIDYSRNALIAHSLMIQSLNDVIMSIVSQQNAQW